LGRHQWIINRRVATRQPPKSAPGWARRRPRPQPDQEWHQRAVRRGRSNATPWIT